MKKTFSWIIFFLACGLVIGAGIHAGANHASCRECKLAAGQKHLAMACHDMPWKKD